MATVSCKVGPGESLKLFYAGKVAPYQRSGELVPGAALQTVAADSTGLCVFPGVTSRIEYAAQRPDGRFIRLLDSTARVLPS